MKEINIEKLKEILDYNPETGIFRWKVKTAIRVNVGDVAGSIINTGYRVVIFNGKKYFANRLAFAFVHGYFPKYIDHLNHKRDDNRISNLREIYNLKNRAMQKNNSSGFTGISWNKNLCKWHTRISVNGKLKHIGYFSNKDDAIKARIQANKKYGFGENHGKRF